MFRPFTLFCALLAGGSGMFLYTKKHQTTVLDQQISKIVADTDHIRQQTAVLQTEWALLNQPDRLSHLAGRFDASLKPMEPRQFVRMADLRQHLPAAVAPRTELAHAAPIAPQAADTGAMVVASRATPDVAPRVQNAEPVMKQAVAAATPVAPARKSQLVLAKAETVAPVLHASESRMPEQRRVAAQDSVKTQIADVTPIETHKTIHHAAAVSDPLAVALGEKTDTTTVHHAASHTLVADNTPIHRAASHDVASLTDTARPTLTPTHHAVTMTHVASADTVAKSRPVTVTAPVTVAAWHPSTAPRYVEARATYSGSLLGHSSIGGGLPPPMPVSN